MTTKFRGDQIDVTTLDLSGNASVAGMVTYETLNTNGDVGTGAGQLATGDHNHNSTYAALSHTHVASDITSGTFANARISQSSVTQHQAALTITESQISDLGPYLTSISGQSIKDLSDVYTPMTPLDGQVLTYDSVNGWQAETPTPGGVTDHGALTGLGDDDHTQYHNDTRGDIRYYTKTQLDAGQLDSRYYTETEADARFVNVTGAESIGGDKTFTNNVIISGNLTVSGTQTIVNSNEVNIGDNTIVLNYDETGTPSQNGGIEIERGTQTNATLLWDEASDVWVAGLVGSTTPISLQGHTHAAADVTSGTFVNARISQSSVTQHQAALSINSSQIPDFTTAVDARISAASIEDLADVAAMTPVDGQVLTYDSVNGWQAETPASGVSDHGALTGLGDDDHTQYHNDVRGDARYYTKTQIDSTLTGYQPADADLTALAGLATTGLVVRTGAGTATTRNIAVSGAGISITNGDGVGGNPVINSNAVSTNTASTLVLRDASGNFAAGAITGDEFRGPLVGHPSLRLVGDATTADTAITSSANGIVSIYAMKNGTLPSATDVVFTVKSAQTLAVTLNHMAIQRNGYIEFNPGTSSISFASFGRIVTGGIGSANLSDLFNVGYGGMRLHLRSATAFESSLMLTAENVVTPFASGATSPTRTDITTAFGALHFQSATQGGMTVGGAGAGAIPGIMLNAATETPSSGNVGVLGSQGVISLVGKKGTGAGTVLSANENLFTVSTNGSVGLDQQPVFLVKGNGDVHSSGGSRLAQTTNQRTFASSYTIVESDGNTTVRASNSATATITIPSNVTIPFPIGTTINFMALTANSLTIAVDTDTLNVRSGLTTTLAGQWAVASAIKVTSTSWVLFGDLGTA